MTSTSNPFQDPFQIGTGTRSGTRSNMGTRPVPTLIGGTGRNGEPVPNGTGRRQHPGKLIASPTARGLHARWCQCGAPILTGLDGDLCAFDATVDWTPLDVLGELVAIAQHRRTYQVERLHSDGSPTLTRRTPRMIRSWPPGTRLHSRRCDVVPEHQCGATPPPSIPTVLIRPSTNTDRGTPPPF